MKYKCKKCNSTFSYDAEIILDIHIDRHEREQKRKEYFEEIEE